MMEKSCKKKIPLTTMLCLILWLLITLSSANDNSSSSSSSKVSFWQLSADQTACRLSVRHFNTYATISVLTRVLSRRLRGVGSIFPYLPAHKIHYLPFLQEPSLHISTSFISVPRLHQRKWSSLLC